MPAADYTGNPRSNAPSARGVNADGGSPPPESQTFREGRTSTALAVVASIATVLVVCVTLLARDPMFFWVGDYQLYFSGMFEEIARAWSEGDFPILNAGSWA